MKKFLLSTIFYICAVWLFSGCVASIGSSGRRGDATLGQQLMDLQKAKQNGAITEEEYQTHKARMLGNK